MTMKSSPLLQTPEQRRDELRGRLYNLFMMLYPIFFILHALFCQTSHPAQGNGSHGAEVLGLGGWEAGPLGCALPGRVGEEWRAEHFPLILPDSPGAWRWGCL